MLCYLQDMDGPGGPLLAVPGSHRSAFGEKPVGAGEEAVVPVDAKAGDVVFFHCDMLHSGSVNRADDVWRYMVTSFVVRAGLPTATTSRPHRLSGHWWRRRRRAATGACCASSQRTRRMAVHCAARRSCGAASSTRNGSCCAPRSDDRLELFGVRRQDYG